MADDADAPDNQLNEPADADVDIEDRRKLVLQVGWQGALQLTTISYTQAEADVQRTLDTSTGPFHDDFQKRSPAFVDVLKQARTESEGTVTEVGLEPERDDHAQVLVAVAVKTTSAGAARAARPTWSSCHDRGLTP